MHKMKIASMKGNKISNHLASLWSCLLLGHSCFNWWFFCSDISLMLANTVRIFMFPKMLFLSSYFCFIIGFIRALFVFCDETLMG